jgi:hypothetical protein
VAPAVIALPHDWMRIKESSGVFAWAMCARVCVCVSV